MNQEYVGTEVEKDEIELDAFMKDLISVINKRFGNLENKLSELEENMSSLERQENSIKKLENEIDRMRANISSLSSSSKLTISKSVLEDLKK